MAELDPSSKAVAQHLRRFTHDENGVQLDDFTDETAVRKGEVARITEDIVAEIGDVPDALTPVASSVAAIGVASQAVIDLDRDLSRDLWDRYQSKLRDLRAKVGAAGGQAYGTQAPTSNFPPPFGAGRHHF